MEKGVVTSQWLLTLVNYATSGGWFAVLRIAGGKVASPCYGWPTMDAWGVR